MTETQDSVVEWCNEHYPGQNARQRLINLFEESTELAAALDVCPLEELLSVVRLAWEKSAQDRGKAEVVPGEIADAQISVFSLASTLGIEVQKALSDKMEKNRKKSLDESRQRFLARQAALGQPVL